MFFLILRRPSGPISVADDNASNKYFIASIDDFCCSDTVPSSESDFVIASKDSSLPTSMLLNFLMFSSSWLSCSFENFSFDKSVKNFISD